MYRPVQSPPQDVGTFGEVGVKTPRGSAQILRGYGVVTAAARLPAETTARRDAVTMFA